MPFMNGTDRLSLRLQQKHTVSAAKKRGPQTESSQPVWLAVEEDSISILEGQSLVSLLLVRYLPRKV